MIEVDPNTLGETAKALLWVIGALLAGGGGYFLGNKRKVQLEPNRVEVAPDALTQLHADFERSYQSLRDDFDAFAENNLKDHREVFLRLTSNEKDVAEIKGQLPHINQSLHRIEGKIDALIGKVRL